MGVNLIRIDIWMVVSFDPLTSFISETIWASSHLVKYQDKKLYKECTEKNGTFGKFWFWFNFDPLYLG
jgi:hypothetical protein